MHIESCYYIINIQRLYFFPVEEARSAYFSSLITTNGNILLEVIDSVVRGSSTSAGSELAEEYLYYFVKKVESIETPLTPHPPFLKYTSFWRKLLPFN